MRIKNPTRFWKTIALTEAAAIACGVLGAFIYVDYKSGNLPYLTRDILNLFVCGGALILIIGGWSGWFFLFEHIMESMENIRKK